MISGFLRRVSDAEGGVSPKRVGGALKMSVGDLSRVTRLHRNTLTRTPHSPSVQARLGEIAQIIAKATEIVGGDEAGAVLWFRHQPIDALDGHTAEQLVADGRADWVLVHLEDLAEGGFA